MLKMKNTNSPNDCDPFVVKKEDQNKDLISNMLHVQDIKVDDPVLKAERDRIASKQNANALFFSI
jgi:hypothetical protein